MLAPSALRSSTRGTPGLLLAALFLAVRLLASSMAMAMATPGADAVGLCHAGPNDDDSRAPAHDGACLVCPACHVAGHAGLPVPASAAVPVMRGGDIGHAAALPAATGPPHRPRVSAHPTGPPTASI